MVNGNSHKMNTLDFCMYGGCWSTYIHKRPNIGNALRGLFTGTQSEKDGSNKARVLSHMSLGVISIKHMDTNKIQGEKARWELHKNVMCCFEQILEKQQL